MSELTTAQRAMYGRMGAAVARARHKPTELTAAARERFLSRFTEQARELHPTADAAEIQRVAGELRRAHFLRLAAASSRARTKRTPAAVTTSAREDGDGPADPRRD